MGGFGSWSRWDLTDCWYRTDYQGRQLQVRQDRSQSGPIPALTPTERALPPQFPEPGDKPDVNATGRTGLASKRGNLPPLRLAPATGYGAFGAMGNGYNGGRMMQGTGMSPVVGRGMAPMTPSMPGFTFHAYPVSILVFEPSRR